VVYSKLEGTLNRRVYSMVQRPDAQYKEKHTVRHHDSVTNDVQTENGQNTTMREPQYKDGEERNALSLSVKSSQREGGGYRI
jgi:hypothetical protein